MATPPTTVPTPTLVLSTLLRGAPITIDGERYQVRHPDALALMQLKRVEIAAPRLGHLLQTPTLTDDEERELSALLVAVCQDVVDAPEAVTAKLTDPQRVAILQVFTQLRSAVQMTGATVRKIPGAIVPTKPTTRGGRSSRA